MAYIDFAYYKNLYKESELSETEFERFLWDAEREIDKATCGIDNVRKLRVAFPVDEYDAETVKRSVCALIDLLHQIETTEKAANSSIGFIERADGALQGKLVSSVSAGNESINYAVGKNADTAISNAIKDSKSKDIELYRFISSRLHGIADANGVNLLYSGPYPCAI